MPKAVHLTKSGSAETAEFSVVDAPAKVAGPGQVVVQMKLCPVNPADIFSIMGVYPGFQPSALPAVPGLEGMGVVSSVGEGVTEFKEGQRVVPFLLLDEAKNGRGSWQQEVVVSTDLVVAVPDAVSDASAAQLVVNPFTALLMIRDITKDAAKGSWVIQSAAGSVLGRQVIQLCKHFGFKTINLVRRPEQAAELEAIGADAVLCPATCPDIAGMVRELTGGEMCVGGLDAVGGDMTAVITSAVKNGGTALLYGAMAGLEFKGSIVDCLFRGVVVRGFWVTPYIASNLSSAKPIAAELLDLMARGVVVPHSGETFPAEKISDAVKASVQAARGGKVLINF